jgi:hypothetical protein
VIFYNLFRQQCIVSAVDFVPDITRAIAHFFLDCDVADASLIPDRERYCEINPCALVQRLAKHFLTVLTIDVERSWLMNLVAWCCKKGDGISLHFVCKQPLSTKHFGFTCDHGFTRDRGLRETTFYSVLVLHVNAVLHETIVLQGSTDSRLQKKKKLKSAKQH